jgi:pyruvate/2-oxoacid:ferredoxin oxidoreductase beta subunit
MRLTIPEEELITPGHKACQGCAAALAMRYALKALGDKTIVVIPACCWTVLEGEFPYTCMKVPLLHTAFETAASASAGVRAAMRAKGRDDVNVVAWAGDGGTFDIGLQALSGAVERNDDFFYICYDNEGYMNCLSISSLILTKHGLKKITEIAVEDEVYAFDQNTHQLVLKKCSGVFDNGVKDVYELQTLHHSIKATGNHPFLVLQRNGRGKKNAFVWKILEELKVGDEIVTLKNKEENESSQSELLAGNEHFETQKVTKIAYSGKEQTLDLRVEDEHNFIADGIVVHNTGIQRSSSTPFGAWTTTTPVESFESSHKKNIMEIMVAHDIPYAATACIAYPEDLVKKMLKAKDIRGSKFIHILAPCSPGWRFPTSQTIKISRLAVETHIFPLYEVENGKYIISRKPKKKPIREYMELQGRFKHLSDEIIDLIQAKVDSDWVKLLKKEED